MVDEAKLKRVMGVILEVDPESLDSGSSIDTVEKWDSLRHMRLVLALEEEFGVTIPDEDAANITSYSLIVVVLNELAEQA